ncbi:MAG TPA: hypothetical protein VF771_11550 [Longimicrobiaceae bacterium]
MAPWSGNLIPPKTMFWLVISGGRNDQKLDLTAELPQGFTDEKVAMDFAKEEAEHWGMDFHVYACAPAKVIPAGAGTKVEKEEKA